MPGIWNVCRPLGLYIYICVRSYGVRMSHENCAFSETELVSRVYICSLWLGAEYKH